MVTKGTDGDLYIPDVAVGTGVSLVLPVLAAELVPTSVTLDWQEVQLVAIRLVAVGTKFWKLHFRS